VIKMELETAPAVNISLLTLRPAQLRRVKAWFKRLTNWDNDEHVRNISRKLLNKDVYLLAADDGFRIFFSKGTDTIKILDITTKETLDVFAEGK